jgi:pyruvate dehydrogenase (quinone)
VCGQFGAGQPALDQRRIRCAPQRNPGARDRLAHPATQIGTGFFQETHPDQLFAECSHFSELVSQPEQMPRLLRIAMQTAVGRGGVSVLAIPGDIAEKRAPVPGPQRVHLAPPLPVVPRDDQVSRLADLLNSGKKVMLFAGAGCRDANDEVIALAERLAAPVGHSFGGKEWIQFDNPTTWA